MFSKRNNAGESKMTREMLRFTIESAVSRHQGRWCQTAVAGYVRLIFGYVWLCLPMFGIVRTVMVLHRFAAPWHRGMQLQLARLLVLVGSRWQRVADGGSVFLGNALADCLTPCNGGLKEARS